MKKRAKPAPNPPQKGLWGWGLPRLMLFLFLLAAAPKGFAGGWEGSGGGGGRAATLAYDAAGRVAALGDTHSNQPWRFGYDAASRLTGAARADYAASYAYDKNGNRTQLTESGQATHGAVVWRWGGGPFGGGKPQADPDGDGVTFTYNLRLPGQYYDKETGLHHNGFRDYDPGLGRYLQSDPVGLAGGINTYVYVGNNPVNWADPLGLDPLCAANGQHIVCTDGMRPPPDGTPLSGPVSPVGVAETAAEAGLAACPVGRGARVAKGISNPVPSIVARVVADNPITRASGTLGRPGTYDVFVTAADDVRGLNAKQIAERLTIPESPTGFRVIEFPTPTSGIASPINRTDPGFIGGGRTAGGAREFVIPNGALPAGSSTRIVP